MDTAEIVLLDAKGRFGIAHPGALRLFFFTAQKS